MEWRDIETAPKDGTRVLYSGPGLDGSMPPWVTCGRWTDRGWFEINTDYSDYYSREDFPTMWQPMPEPPQ